MRSDERQVAPAAPPPDSIRVEGHERQDLIAGWQVAACAPDSCPTPAGFEGLEWLPAAVPGTAAGALRAAARWDFGDQRNFDTEDWWFRTEFELDPAAAAEVVLLRLDGVATVHEVFLNGRRIATGESMFAAVAIEIGDSLREGKNELAIRCLALVGQLGKRRGRRARWRTRLADNRLRFIRTMLLGRCPGFAPGPAAVGPWRPVWIERRRGVVVSGIELRTRCEGDDGVLTVRLRGRRLDGAPVEVATVTLADADETASAPLIMAVAAEDGGFELSGELRIPGVHRWWPHTHGTPALYEASLHLAGPAGEIGIDAGRVGFRDLAAGPGPNHDLLTAGLDLQVNGVAVFARGAVWTPDDFVGMAPDRARLREALERVREAGMNMVRVVGTGAYESPDFHELCAELGILVWQDFMFANFDYPLADTDFREGVEAEVAAQLAALAGRPSLVVLCGNSEVEQQVSMLGLDQEIGRGELFGGLIPAAIERANADAIYIPSAPCGGERPFRPDRGVANYFGVGGYRRPLTDARLAKVRFASECLAFANVPEPAGVDAVLHGAPAEVVVHHPRWKAGVPRDAGTGWDFDDVRDHYLRELFGVDPAELRRHDHERYLELSRAVSGEAMGAVFGEWRRAGSGCGGGLVLWSRDLVPGAGWGLVDHSGVPKAAYHSLRRALAPTAVWLTDEGLAGVGVHVANDGPGDLHATLRLAVYGAGGREIDAGREELALAPHTAISHDAETIIGRFLDASWAYRFGPPAELIVASLERGEGGEAEPLAQATMFPAGRPAAALPAAALGLEVEAVRGADGVGVVLGAALPVYGVRVDAPGHRADDAWFCLEPGIERRLRLRPAEGAPPATTITVAAVGMKGGLHAAIA